ncbi:MAG: hypothetical protein JW795_11665 [Chitinivibrionales bacterium]|nr:hypothetical protein [Chitinivibrionales bacterium]
MKTIIVHFLFSITAAVFISAAQFPDTPSASGVTGDAVLSIAPADSTPKDTLLFDSPHDSDRSVHRSGSSEQVQQLYAFKAKNTPLDQALTLFCASNGLVLKTETKINGKVSVSFEKKNLGQAMALLLKGSDLTWHLTDNNTLVLSSPQSLLPQTAAPEGEVSALPKPLPLSVIDKGDERIFKINYPRLKRTGIGSSAATVSSTASGEAGSIQLSTSDELVFWQDIEEQVKQFVSPSGRLVANRLAGIIQVRDAKDNLESIQRFLEAVIPAVTRQVEITARIYEVTLNNDKSLGVDWNSVYNKFSFKDQNNGIHNGVGTIASHLIQTGPSFKAATLNLAFSLDDKILNTVVSALKEQGDVRVVSQPRVVTLNNQPALVKVGTDLPFFSATITINPSTNQKEIAEEVRVITVGVVLSVTPQISDDGWITLGIDPLISDLVSTMTSSNGSTAPVVDVKQSSTLIRLMDRQTVRISGLLQTKKSSVHRKIPLLGDIPFAGSLFQWQYTHDERKELIIFITPRIL